jgi:probable F420-dependent oxidoreductase
VAIDAAARLSAPTFGLALGGFSAAVATREQIVGLARDAETLGFDSLEVGDHVQWHRPIFESTTLMATFAAVTSRVRIASDVVILPLRDPVLMAKTMASLDVLSGGRVTFGIGVGGDNPAEYTAMRIPRSERGSRADESLDIVRGLFEQERFSYRGRHFTLEDVAIAPRPLQPRLPIWVGGTSEAALRRAARYGDGWIAAFASERKFARLVEDLFGLLSVEGRPTEGYTLGTFLFTLIDDDAGRARAHAAEHVHRVYQLDGEAIVDRFGAAGPVETCLERVHRYLEAGARHVVLYPLCEPADWPRQLERFGEVMTRVRGGR